MVLEFECPLCSQVIEEDDDGLEVGDVVWCDKCYRELKVTSLHPVKVEGMIDEDECGYDDDSEAN